MRELGDVITAIRAAVDSASDMLRDRDHTCADWTHYVMTGSSREVDDPVDSRAWADSSETGEICDGDTSGGTDCDTCYYARISVRLQRAYARDALRQLARGNTLGARGSIRGARAAEYVWGDVPTWGPIADALEQLVSVLS